MFKPHQTALMTAALGAFLTMTVPYLHLLLLPLQYLNTHTHELCHALTAVATGGSVSHIDVFANGSGETPIGGSIMTLTASAGYVGASLIGAAMIFFGRTPEKARRVLFGLGAILAISMLIWVRGDLVGIISGLGWAAALLYTGTAIKGPWSIYLVQFLGVEQCLSSLGALLVLLHISTATETQSDASIMQSVSGIPAIVWAVAWSCLSLGLMFVALRAAWRAKA